MLKLDIMQEVLGKYFDSEFEFGVNPIEIRSKLFVIYERYGSAQTVITPGYTSGGAYSAGGHLLGSNAGNYGITSATNYGLTSAANYGLTSGAAYPSSAYVSGGSGLLATGGKVLPQGIVASSYPSGGIYGSNRLYTAANGYAGHGSLLSANSGLR